MNLLRSAALAAVLGSSPLVHAAASGTPETASSFEFTDLTGHFTVGSAPHEVHFTGGMANTIGVLSLYHSGFFAWMITPSGSGTISFETPAKEISFFARTQTATTTALITVVGADGSSLGTFSPNNTGWTAVSVSSADPQIVSVLVQHTGGTGVVAIDTFAYCANDTGQSFCFGDGGDQAGCTACPCANEAPQGSGGGCLNSAGSSSVLLATGAPSVAADTLRFELTGAPPLAFCILNSGDNIAPQNAANPCFGLSSGSQSVSFDGLRCAVGNTRRHGGRSADSNGSVGIANNGWGPPNGPMAGFAAQAGFVAGQSRAWQVVHREDAAASCMRGLNTSQAIRVTYLP